jgi:hypothetical protein
MASQSEGGTLIGGHETRNRKGARLALSSATKRACSNEQGSANVFVAAPALPDLRALLSENDFSTSAQAYSLKNGCYIDSMLKYLHIDFGKYTSSHSFIVRVRKFMLSGTFCKHRHEVGSRTNTKTRTTGGEPLCTLII